MLTICFDVNGTLVIPEGPRYEIIQILLTLKRLGHTIYVWSSGGVTHSEEWVARLGLGVPVIEKGSITPDIAVDDMESGLGVVDLKV